MLVMRAGGDSPPGSATPNGWFIASAPERADILDGLDVLIEIDGFDDVGICAQFITLDNIAVRVRGAHHNHGQPAKPRVSPDLLEHFEPADFGHFNIEQHHTRHLLPLGGELLTPKQIVEGLGSVACDNHLVDESGFF